METLYVLYHVLNTFEDSPHCYISGTILNTAPKIKEVHAQVHPTTK